MNDEKQQTEKEKKYCPSEQFSSLALKPKTPLAFF